MWAGLATSRPTLSMTSAVLDFPTRSEEHTSELQSHSDLVCRLLLEKKKKHTLRHTVKRLPSFLDRSRAGGWSKQLPYAGNVIVYTVFQYASGYHRHVRM